MPTIEQIINEQQRMAAEQIKKNLPTNINEVVEDIKKAKRAQMGEVREWGGVKMRKEAQGWVPVKEGNKTPKQDEEGKPNDAATPEALADHATKASEAALVNATKQSTDPAVRQAAHKELQRRKNEEAQETFKAPDVDENGKPLSDMAKEGKASFEKEKADKAAGKGDYASGENKKAADAAKEKEAKKEPEKKDRITSQELSNFILPELESAMKSSGMSKEDALKMLRENFLANKKENSNKKEDSMTKFDEKALESMDSIELKDEMKKTLALMNGGKINQKESKRRQDLIWNAAQAQRKKVDEALKDVKTIHSSNKIAENKSDIKKSTLSDKEALEMAAKFQTARKEGKTQGEALREALKMED